MRALSPVLPHRDDGIDSASGASRMRLCFPFSGDTVGGSHISVKGLLSGLDPQRYHPIVVTEVPGGRISQFFADQEQFDDPGSCGLFVPGEIFTPRKFARTLRGVWPRVRFLRRQQIDIVHVNDGQTNANWALAARLAGAKLVWHHRGDPDARGLRFLAPLLADQVLAVSSFALPAPGRWSARKKASVVYSPFNADLNIDRASARARLSNELRLTTDTLILGFFGAFLPRKRPLLFIDMIAELARTLNQPVMGVMFGEAVVASADAALRSRISKQRVEDQVRLMGFRTPGPFWIAACDQLVVPAVREPFGRTLIEAMLVGTPIVAARSGGNIEALEGGLGILVEPDDPVALAGECARLSRDPDGSATMVCRTQAEARRRFSEAAHSKRVSEVYERLRTHP